MVTRMRRRALRGAMIVSLSGLLAVAPPPAGAAAAPADGDPYQKVSLALAQSLVAMFPAAQGYVVSVDGGEAFVDLAEKDLMRPGMELQLYRAGADMVHPVTKQVLGTYETDLGHLRLIEVRDTYSRGTIEAAGGATVAAGDRARVSARRLRALLALSGAAPGVEPGPLALALLGRGNESGRFTMVDEPAWAPALAALGTTPQAIAADPASLRALGAKAGADLLLLVTVEAGARPIVAVDVRSLRTGAPLGVLREAWPSATGPEPVAALAPVGSRPPPRRSPLRPSPRRPPATGGAAAARRARGRGGVRHPGTARGWRGTRRREHSRRGARGGRDQRRRPPRPLSLGRAEAHLALGRGAAGGRRLVSLDAADLDGDGRAEVLVSTVTWGRVATQVRSWRDGKLETIATAEGVYLRAAPRAGAPALLLGQRAGIDEVLAGRVEEYRLGSGSVERVDGTALPRAAEIFGLALAPAGVPAAFYALGRNSYLYGYDAAGKALWRSGRTYGGYPPPLREQDLGGGGTLEGQAFEDAMLAFQGRVLAEPAGGGVRLAVPRNFFDVPFVAVKMRSLGKGEIVLLEGPPGASSLEETGRSRSFDGYVADLARADVDGDGRAETLFLVNRNAGPLVGERAKLVSWSPPGPSAGGK